MVRNLDTFFHLRQLFRVHTFGVVSLSIPKDRFLEVSNRSGEVMLCELVISECFVQLLSGLLDQSLSFSSGSFSCIDIILSSFTS